MAARARSRPANGNAHAGRPRIWPRAKPRAGRSYGTRRRSGIWRPWRGFILASSLAFLLLQGHRGPESLLTLDLPPAFSSSEASFSSLAGRADVIDGDTLEIDGRRIRLLGVDAPESGQSCQDESGARYSCGRRAANALAEKIAFKTVSCEQRDLDSYGRIVAVCTVAGEDLNAWLVRQGWAVAYQRYSWAYVGEEVVARWNGRGIWAGDFTNPETWRHAQ